MNWDQKINQKKENPMLKRIAFAILATSLSTALVASLSYAEKKTTTVEQTSTETSSTPASSKSKKAVPVTTTTTSNTRYTTTKEAEPRIVLDQEALKKMSKTLCTEGFKSYVSNDKKNICQYEATAPDIAYSCVWNKKGDAAFAPTRQGPCNLDFTEHRGSMIVSKSDYTSRPPLSYGTEVHCCFRAAQDQSVSSR
ncbi:MAG: hypothetical protein Q7S98_06840 [Deltaproteobacteria bacterium]|nr:hypothetical protein [Deltaproteobacteria bacterium]